jgi:predicted alpha/beta hydrolase
MMVDSRTFHRQGEGLAPFLASQGWRVFTADFRGRANSGPRPSAGGRWNYDDIINQDLPAIMASVRVRIGEQPLVFIGHSLGGHTGIAAAGLGLFKKQPDAFVLLSSNIWRPSLEPSQIRRLKKAVQFWIFDHIAQRMGYFPSRRVRMGSCDEPAPYVADLRRTWSADHWGSGDGQFDYTEAAARVNVPVLSVVGRGDRLLAHHVGAKNWFDAIGSERREFWLAERGRFGLSFDPDHMTLVTSQAARPIWVAIETWMQNAILDATPRE